MTFGYSDAAALAEWPNVHWNAASDRRPDVWHVWRGEFNLRFTGTEEESEVVREVLNRLLGRDDAVPA